MFFSSTYTYLTSFLAGFDPCAVEGSRDCDSRDGARQDKTLVIPRSRHSVMYGYYIPIRQSYRSEMSQVRSSKDTAEKCTKLPHYTAYYIWKKIDPAFGIASRHRVCHVKLPLFESDKERQDRT